MQKIFLEVLNFVKQKHGLQVRKYTGEPYWVHCLNVALFAKEYLMAIYNDTPDKAEMNNAILRVQLIALCHDLFEDTDCQVGELWDFVDTTCRKHGQEGCGLKVALGVLSLTDIYTKENCPELNRSLRKELEAERIANLLDSDIKLIKLCDIMDNTRSIVQFDRPFASTYLKEKKYLIDQISLLRDNNHKPLHMALGDARYQLNRLTDEITA
jgi:(p)ppGpp synthase/HD superfamily hydrolase